MSEIATGHEQYSENGEIDINASIRSIQDTMFARNPEKYGNFLGTIKKINLALKIMGIPMNEIRVELFRCMYYAMRLVDDIVDGDTIPPLPLEQRKEIMDSILSGNIDEIKNPLYKTLAIRISDLARKLGLEAEMSQASLDILQSMNFDLLRIIDIGGGKDGIRNQDELSENFHKMDIVGTIRGTTVIFGIEPENAIEILGNLGEACRIIYNLTDFIDDIKAGLINIPREDLEKFGITKEDLERVKERDFTLSELPDSIKTWFQQEIVKYLQRMKVYEQKILQGLQFMDGKSGKGELLHGWRNFLMQKIVLVKTYIEDNQKRLNKILGEIS